MSHHPPLADDTSERPLPGPVARLWHRDLAHYPDAVRRYAYLAIVVVTTIVLYYELYVQYAVATSVITHFHMTYKYFVWVSVIGNAVGAFTSLLAGLADRWGRANLVVYGLLGHRPAVAPRAAQRPGQGRLPRAVRRRRVRRRHRPGRHARPHPRLLAAARPGDRDGLLDDGSGASAAWSSPSSPAAPSTSASWQDELRYSGIAGLIVFVVALFGLRELSPGLRDQIMVSLRDRALVEARAKAKESVAGAGAAQRWRQMLHLDVVGSALAISLFLLLYFAAVGNLVVYFSTNFGYSQQRTNGLANWYWAANAIALVAAGLLSDLLKVRKPFMLVGALGSIALTSTFAVLATHPHTGYYTFAWLFVGIGALSGVAYAPWMAGFTETVEKRNPAATATGLAIWGWIIRIVVAVSTAFIPLVVSSASPLVDHGTQVATAQAKAAPALAIVDAHPALFAQLAKYPPTAVPPALAAQAVQQVGPADLAVVQKAQPQLAVLQKYGPQVQTAAADGPGQWQTWWWVAVAGQVIFLPFIFAMAGRWSPKRAKRDAERHRQAVESELTALAAESG